MNLEILSEADIRKLRELISNTQNIVICGHKSPDGDAIGSSLAWADYLCQQGKSPVVVMPDAYPDFLQWLPGTEKILRYDKKPDEVKEAFDKLAVVA